jgi:hypothetical protein
MQPTYTSTVAHKYILMANSIYVTGSITWYIVAHYTFYEAEEFVFSVHCCTVHIYYHVFPYEPISILGKKQVTP